MYSSHSEERLDPQGIDARGFLVGGAYIWVTQNSNMKHPLMQGQICIPIELIDFVHQYSMLSKFRGRQALPFRVSLWEANPSNYYSDSPPQYTGNISLDTKKLMSPFDEMYNVIRRNRSIQY